MPAHLERAGPFDPASNKGWNVEHLRDFNNAAPQVAFGFESQPGHGAANNRGEYQIKRNNIGGVLTDSVGGTTYGGTGVYAAYVGGVWDALLGEGRNWWFFASSDWHTRNGFGGDDRRSTGDFWPGEYQRNYTLVRNGTDKLRPQTIVDGLRSGNNWVAGGQLIDRLAFVACASYPGRAARSNASVEALASNAAYNATDSRVAGCATMGQKLVVRPGADIVVAVAVRGAGVQSDLAELGRADAGQVLAVGVAGLEDGGGVAPDFVVDLAAVAQGRLASGDARVDGRHVGVGLEPDDVDVDQGIEEAHEHLLGAPLILGRKGFVAAEAVEELEAELDRAHRHGRLLLEVPSRPGTHGRRAMLLRRALQAQAGTQP